MGVDIGQDARDYAHMLMRKVREREKSRDPYGPVSRGSETTFNRYKRDARTTGRGTKRIAFGEKKNTRQNTAGTAHCRNAA